MPDSAIQDLPVGVVFLKADGSLLHANRAAQRLLPGIEHADNSPRLHSPTWCLLTDRSEWVGDDLQGFFGSRLAREPIFDTALRVVGRSGAIALLRASTYVSAEASSEWHHAIVLVELTEDGEQRRVLDQTVRSAGLGTWQLDLQSQRVKYNELWFSMLGHSRESWPQDSSTWEALVHPQDRDRVIDLVNSGIHSAAHSFRTEYRLKHREGHYVWVLLAGAAIDFDIHARPTKVVGIHHNITAAKNLEQRLLEAARTDALTGLWNRGALSQAIRSVPQQVGQNGTHGLLYMDLDRFKLVNDTLGHLAGDELLRKFSARLMGGIEGWSRERPGESRPMLARVGGDEFLLFIGPVDGVAAVEALAQRLIESVSRPFVVMGRQIHSGMSLGLSASSGRPPRFDELLRNADIALNEAKRAGRGGYKLYNDGMHESVVRSVGIEAGLRESLRTGTGLQAHYQPIVDLRSGRTIGFEALARWSTPTTGSVSPVEFIPIAEDCGLIDELGQLMLARVCEDLVVLRNQPGLEEVWIAINVSRLQLLNRDYCKRLLSALTAHGLPLSAIHVEVTESIAMTDECVRSALFQLREAGFSLSLDDFGTGYSSLSMLEEMPVATVKIDRAFVNGVAADNVKMTLVRATVMVCSAIKLKVVAEGIETMAQATLLLQAGCDLGQGYLFGRPQSLDVILGDRCSNQLPTT